MRLPKAGEQINKQTWDQLEHLIFYLCALLQHWYNQIQRQKADYLPDYLYMYVFVCQLQLHTRRGV